MADEAPAYTAWLRTLPCRRCGRPSELVHHRTGAGMGLRAHDHDGMPLCDRCHRSLHQLTWGPFGRWTGVEVRTWETRQVCDLRAAAPAYVLEQTRRAPKRRYRWPKRALPKGRKIPSRPLRSRHSR